MTVHAPMPINEVSSVLTKCWLRAENQVRILLEKKYWDGNEEFITELFHGELRESLEEVSKSKELENAFLSDLYAQFPELEDQEELQEIFGGIGAISTRHSKQVEGRTGGDFGLLIIRPSVTYSTTTNRSISRNNKVLLKVEKEYCCGLLCQAKLKKFDQTQRSKWGNFTPSQEKILPKKTEYLSLLLYEYIDIDNRSLNPFYWQLCKGATIKDMKSWFKSNNFPGKHSSPSVIKGLCNGDIGTDDPEIINQYISPKAKKSFVIRVGWFSDKKPPDDPFGIYENIRRQTQTHTTRRLQVNQ